MNYLRQWRLNDRAAYTVLFGPRHWVSYFIILLVTCPCDGQVFKKEPVTAKDYHLWGTLLNDKISDHGRWVSFAMHYDEHPDTLFVKRSDAKKTFSFPKAMGGVFCGERYFGVLNTEQVLSILDLKTGLIVEHTGVMQFSFSGDGNLVTFLTDKNELVISQVNGPIVAQLNDVQAFKVNADQSALVCSGTTAGHAFVQLVTLSGTVKTTEIYSGMQAKISMLVWQSNGQALVFLERPESAEGSNLFYYAVAAKQLHQFDAKNFDPFPLHYHVENEYANGLTISGDGQKVFFTIKKDAAVADKFDGVQQWNGNDAVLYPERVLMGESINARVVCWSPIEHKIAIVTDSQFPFALFNPTYDYALLYGVDDLEPQYRLVRNANYYLADLKKGTKTLFLENQSAELNENSFSPGGRYYAYFRDGSWWTYAFGSGERVRRTSVIKSLNEEDKTERETYPVAGWGVDDSCLLVYDQFDIWKISLDGAAPVKLTHGHESGITYRIVAPTQSEFYTSIFSGRIGSEVDLKRSVLLSMEKENNTGFCLLGPNGKIQNIVFDNSLNKDLQKAAKTNVFVFQSQDYDKPPVLKIATLSGKAVGIFKSNTQHSKFLWGKQEIISYENAAHKPLKGLLYYPAGFDPAQKYPMIVHIYERQWYMQHYYNNPSANNMAGFNIANFTAKGYFVMLPDIEYELGNPGISATDCVVAAMKEVLKKGFVKSDKIALIGHSFGGYETNFIISQTDLFACAVSGAGVSDLRSWYLSMGWNWGWAEIWRFESQQWRMGKSLFDDRESYERNSPIAHVEKVHTPVLLWSGENDRQIHYYQSIAYYLALRRLDKKEIMLLYPGDGHALVNRKNQTDLTTKLENWFGYFLKDEKDKSWIKEGIK